MRVKRHNPFLCWLLNALTFGLYKRIWTASLVKDINLLLGDKGSAAETLVAMSLPVFGYSLIACDITELQQIYKEKYDNFPIFYSLLGLTFPSLALCMMQTRVNRIMNKVRGSVKKKYSFYEVLAVFFVMYVTVICMLIAALFIWQCLQRYVFSPGTAPVLFG